MERARRPVGDRRTVSLHAAALLAEPYEPESHGAPDVPLARLAAAGGEGDHFPAGIVRGAAALAEPSAATAGAPRLTTFARLCLEWWRPGEPSATGLLLALSERVMR